LIFGGKGSDKGEERLGKEVREIMKLMPWNPTGKELKEVE
jgi:hypothetical protein